MMSKEEVLNMNSVSTSAPKENVYFIGIGGIGMSALARYFHENNFEVSGYDKTRTTLTIALEEMGIKIHYIEDINLIPKQVKYIIYTPAIPIHQTELVYYKTNGYTLLKRSDILQIITQNTFNICIAGTHGKTTTTSMVAHILRDSGFGCTAFLGGIATNYNSNFWGNDNNVVVVEADEYDRSFLKLSPDIALITAMDADHLDIYGTAEEVKKAFIQFSNQIKKEGHLIHKYGIEEDEVFTTKNLSTYSLSNTLADTYITNLSTKNGTYQFSIKSRAWELNNVTLNMGGLHNIENVIAAISIAKILKVDEDKILKAVASFKGVKRRFEYHIKTDNQILIDDYAHHPEELRALISGVRSLFTDKKITLVFQPHLYSRTNDLADAFAESLSMADEVMLLPLYPARELPIEGVTSHLVLDKMQLENKQVLSKEDFFTWISSNKRELIVMAGAGDIDVMVQEVKKIVSN